MLIGPLFVFGDADRSDFHDLCGFLGHVGVDLAFIFFEEFLDLVFELGDLVFGVVGAGLLVERVGVLVGVATGVPHDDFLFFADLLRLGDELLAAIGGEGWDVDPDLLVFDHWVDAEVGFFDRGADRANGGGVEWFDQELGRFWDGDHGE